MAASLRGAWNQSAEPLSARTYALEKVHAQEGRKQPKAKQPMLELEQRPFNGSPMLN